MTSDSIVTAIGTVVTLLGMLITIWQASAARNYKNQVRSDIRRINLVSVSGSLKRAQEEIRRLPTSNQVSLRGVRPSELIQKAREHFDSALGILDSTGPDANVRSLLGCAQKKLNSYEISWNSGQPKPQDVHELQTNLQDAVSELSNTIFKMEGKA
ncbi:hypothetical protein K5D42_05390 [Pseudomonas cichorii]|nr:hypothetical protein [Pseudomonas cichorii]MBX8489304.1 hypothetical protein [Pseudomonas cichorii]